jgi:hypothetical protein
LGGNLLSKRSIDTTLGGDSVRTSGEELGDTGSVEASLGETEGSTQTRTTGTDDNGIVLVILLQSEFHFSIHFCISCRRFCRLTMTGYFSEINPSAAFARRGPGVQSRAADRVGG